MSAGQSREPPLPWLIYALGNGWGHLNRAVALARVAAHQRPVVVLTNSPYLPQVAIALGQMSSPFPLELRSLPLGAPSVRRAWVQQQCRTQAECLIVDTFPRGIVGELIDVLPQLAIPKVLVHRDLNPQYLEKKPVTPGAAGYDLILMPGDGTDLPFAHLPQAQQTPPWLVRRASELPDRMVMRSHLGILPHQSLILVCATGQGAEAPVFGRLTAELSAQIRHHQPPAAVRCLAAACPPGCPPELWCRHWPGLDYLQGADVVVSGAGYNIVHECRALGLPLVALAFPRTYDRQRHRAQRFAHWVDREADAIAQVLTHLQSQTPRSQRSPRLDDLNGAEIAARLIAQQIELRT